jgi:hypothetical protein
MSLRESRRKVEERERDQRNAGDAAHRERERIVIEDTRGIIERRNAHLAAGRRPLVSPTLAAAEIGILRVSSGASRLRGL